MERLNDNLADSTDYSVQKIPYSRKGKKWREANVDRIIGSSSFDGSYFNRNDTVNKNLAKGITDVEDFRHITNPYGLDNMSMPADLLNFNIIGKNKKFLVGEEIRKPFEYGVISSSRDTVSEYSQMEENLLRYHINDYIMKKAQRDGFQGDYSNPLASDEKLKELKTPEDLIKHARRNIKTSREIQVYGVLEYLKQGVNFDKLFNEGWSDYIDCNKEIYAVETHHNKPTLRKVETDYFECASNPNSYNVEEAEWACELRYLQPHDLTDLFYGRMSDSLKKKLKDMSSWNMNGNFSLPGNEIGPFNTTKSISFKDKMSMGESGTVNQTLIPVFKVNWISQQQIRFWHYVDADGTEQIDLVPEDFKAKGKAKFEGDVLVEGEYIEDDYINELWEGYRIGDDEFLGIQPVDSFYSSMDNISEVKIPYVGIIKREPSLVEQMKPYQYMYMVILFRLQMILASDKGRVMLMDITQIPSKMGWNVKKWLYYLDAMKIAFVDPYSEGHIKRNGKPATFNQFQSIDLSTGNQIDKYINMLDKIDFMLGDMVGIPANRRGQTHTSETVGGIQSSIDQSSYITEYMFLDHEDVKQRAVRALIDASKPVLKDGKALQTFTSDGSRLLLEVDGDLYSYSEYDVWIVTKSKFFRKTEQLRGLAREALAAGKLTFDEAVTVILEDNNAIIRETIREGSLRAEQNMRATEDNRNNTQLQIHQEQMIEKDKQRAADDALNMRDNITKLTIARESVETNNNSGRMDANEELLKLEKDSRTLALQETKVANDFYTKQKELAQRQQQHNDKMELSYKQLAKKTVSAN